MKDDSPKIRLRPVVYTTNKFKRGAQNTTQQMMLLKALQITSDPEKLKQLIHVKTVAEVYRTLDKLAMRKEYHEALARSGLSFDFIVDGIKSIALTGEKDADKLKAYQVILKSLGMEKYDRDETSLSGTWEEELIKRLEGTKVLKDVSSDKIIPKYEVEIPEIPESARLMESEEEEMTSSIYDEKK